MNDYQKRLNRVKTSLNNILKDVQKEFPEAEFFAEGDGTLYLFKQSWDVGGQGEDNIIAEIDIDSLGAGGF